LAGVPQTEKIRPVAIETEMRRSYIKYAMSVIVGRALPDVHDGLKPVQRRILYAIQGLGLTSKGQHKKSARVVGEVLGKYHPHGDMAVYDALVRMAQDFSMRYPLVDGQGNFGSLDGDEPAAMRYTEARLARLAEEMLSELDMDTVDWMQNFDDSLKEPIVLPARFPNLLVNGASGIAVGMSCNIPPHNMREVADALVFLVDHPNARVEDLLDFIKGPDFPTGGIIYDATSLLQTYKQGRGLIKILARIDQENLKGDRKRLVVSEIPFQVNKSKVVEDIANLVREGELEGISNIRDESSREGIRVTIDLRAGVQPEGMKSQLYKQTQLHSSFSFINLVLVDGRPQILDLKETLQAFINHRIRVIERRSKFQLQEAQERLNVLEGYTAAIKNIDNVITIIRGSQGPREAAGKLRDLELNDKQIEAILQMRLQQLTRLEVDEVEKEADDKRKEIQNLQQILGKRAQLLTVLKSELIQVKEMYGDKRRTEIRPESINLNVEQEIQDEQVLVFLSIDGYIKRVSLRPFTVADRGSEGVPSIDLKEQDKVLKVLSCRTTQTMILLTNLGRAYTMNAHEIPEGTRSARGTPLVNLLQIADGERIVNAVSVNSFPPNLFLTMITKHGTVKRTPLDGFANVRSNGIIATQFDENDNLADVTVTSGDGQIVIGTVDGVAIRFNESEIPVLSRIAKGVVGVRLASNREVVGGCFLPPKQKDLAMFLVTRNGYSKRTSVEQIRLQKRGGSGVTFLKSSGKSGDLVSLVCVSKEDHVLVVSERGEAIRLSASSIPTQGRSSSGVRMTKLKEHDGISSVTTIPVDQQPKPK